MVTIVSLYKNDFPARDGSLKISGKTPIYSQETIENNVISATPWTRKCRNDVFNLGFSNQDLLALIQHAVRSGKFKGSEWCESKPGGPWAACDAYQVSRYEADPVTGREIQYFYFVKFCISDTGTVLLAVSCHV